MSVKQIMLVAMFMGFSLLAVAAPKMAGGNVLGGTQEEDAVTLEDRKKAYVVEGEYVVPVGKTLTIKEGVTVLFMKGAGLLVQGELSVEGATNAPVVFNGKSTGIGYWAGIKIEKSNSSDISCAVISGAKDGVTFSNCEAAIRKSVLYRNDVGIRCNEGKPTIEDCVIAQNRGDGIAIFRSHPQIDHCLIDKNGGLGVGGVYYAHATLANSIVSNNRKGGVKSELWDCHVSAKECAFLNNKGFEVESGTGCPWDFTENFWGDGMTGFLKARGCNVRLPKIKDKRHGDSGLGLVDVNKFLLKMPEDCGPRECVRVKGVN